MIIEKTKDSIILKELSEEEMLFFEDKIEFWMFLEKERRKRKQGQSSDSIDYKI